MAGGVRLPPAAICTVTLAGQDLLSVPFFLPLLLLQPLLLLLLFFRHLTGKDENTKVQNTHFLLSWGKTRHWKGVEQIPMGLPEHIYSKLLLGTLFGDILGKAPLQCLCWRSQSCSMESGKRKSFLIQRKIIGAGYATLSSPGSLKGVQIPAKHPSNTFGFLPALFSSSDLARPLLFSISPGCTLWFPMILEPLPVSSGRVLLHGVLLPTAFCSLLWGSRCSSVPINNRGFSQTCFIQKLSPRQPVPSSRIAGQWIFWTLDQICPH